MLRRRPSPSDERQGASEQALAELEAQRLTLEQALNGVRQGIVMIGPDDAVTFMNPASVRLIRPAAILGQLTPHALQSLVRSVRATKASQELELEVGRPARIVQATATPLGTGSTLVVLEDVTEARRVEAIRRDFVTAASHELKTPVAAIAAAAETLGLALDRDPEIVARLTAQLQSSAQQLTELVRDLLDLSRLEGVAPTFHEIELADVVRTEVRELSRRVVEDLEPVTISGSRSDIALAVRNLLDNALRHTPMDGVVTARVRRVGAEAWIEVSDTGEGISSRDLPRVFERFFRVDTARARATGGTGLGLAIVRHVAESHGGKAEVESELGVGSTFRLRLPLGAQ